MPRKNVPPSDEPRDDLPSYDWTRYPGIQAPTYTQTPDEIFDWIAPLLSEPELRVLLYIIRRTFGFKKGADAISIDQMCNGIVTRDGKRLDYGTGLSRSPVQKALRTLREKNVILAQRQIDADGGSGPTLYALNVIGGLFPTLRDRITAGADPRMQSHKEGGVSLDTPGLQWEEGGVSLDTPGRLGSDRGASTAMPPGILLDTPGHLGRHRGARERIPREYPVEHRQETVEQQRVQQDDRDSKTSNRPQTVDKSERERTQGSITGQLVYSALVSQILADYSRMFHDADNQRSNRTRAMRLYANSGLREDTFVSMLHEARRIAQSRGNIQKDATDGSPAGTKNRMPYFFEVVEDLVSMAVETPEDNAR